MMTKTTLILIFITFIFQVSWSQDSISNKGNWRLFPSDKEKTIAVPTNGIDNTLNYASKDGKIQVFQDQRIDAIGTELREKPYIYGYTLQLEVSQQKNVIKDARYKIMKINPNIELDDPYESPNIYLYAGRFYDRASAYEYKNKISSQFPNAIVVGPRKMDLPAIEMPQLEIPKQDSTDIVDPRND
jgi:hypothetical protein